MQKKLFLVCLLSLFCSVNLLIGGNPVSVKSGNVSVLKEVSKALLEIDYSEAKVGKLLFDEYLKEQGEDYVRDWPRESETAISYFRERFNKKSKGIKLTTDESVTSYKILIRPKTIDMGNAGSYFVSMAIGVASNKAGGVIMCGSIDIIDLKTDQVVCSLYVDDVKGKSHYKDAIRMGYMYDELAKKICKLKK